MAAETCPETSSTYSSFLSIFRLSILSWKDTLNFLSFTLFHRCFIMFHHVLPWDVGFHLTAHVLQGPQGCRWFGGQSNCCSQSCGGRAFESESEGMRNEKKLTYEWNIQKTSCKNTLFLSWDTCWSISLAQTADDLLLDIVFAMAHVDCWQQTHCCGVCGVLFWQLLFRNFLFLQIPSCHDLLDSPPRVQISKEKSTGGHSLKSEIRFSWWLH